MRAADVINAVPIPKYWKDCIRKDEDLNDNPWVICPFHPDRHPSMKYTPEKKLCKCFSCGAGGNVIQIHMKNRGIKNYQEAVEDLGRLYKVQAVTVSKASIDREIEATRESLDYSLLQYKATTIAKIKRDPKIYCELDDIMSHSVVPYDKSIMLKDFIDKYTRG
jgi:hypothetical protein